MSSRASTVRIRAVEPSVVPAVEPVVEPASGAADEGALGEAGMVTAELEAAGGVGAVSSEEVCAMAGASIAISMAAGRITALVIPISLIVQMDLPAPCAGRSVMLVWFRSTVMAPVRAAPASESDVFFEAEVAAGITEVFGCSLLGLCLSGVGGLGLITT